MVEARVASRRVLAQVPSGRFDTVRSCGLLIKSSTVQWFNQISWCLPLPSDAGASDTIHEGAWSGDARIAIEKSKHDTVRNDSIVSLGQPEYVMSLLAAAEVERPFNAVSPLEELGAYEHLWQANKAASVFPSFKSIATLFKEHPGALPSDLVPGELAARCARDVLQHFDERGVKQFGVRINGLAQYPEHLRDAEHPLEFFYYQGWWDLVESPKRIAIVGTRKPSEEGKRRARKLVRQLVRDNFVVVSGLATGIDTVAHETTIEAGGQTIAVIGTPISETYPRENAELQQRIGRDFLLISQ